MVRLDRLIDAAIEAHEIAARSKWQPVEVDSCPILQPVPGGDHGTPHRALKGATHRLRSTLGFLPPDSKGLLALGSRDFGRVLALPRTGARRRRSPTRACARSRSGPLRRVI